MAETRLFLAIDNCFASKRWCEVDEWMRVIGELGLRCVEASADNEIDPLYSCQSFLQDWTRHVRRASDRTGIRVVNCYSGHGTYSTLGLAHHDARVRAHLREHWFRPMVRTAGALGAGLGFFAHAFSERMLRNRDLYDQAYRTLIDDLQAISRDALTAAVQTCGVEQMYTPHQVPWTITGTAEFLRRVNAKPDGLPMYITLDTGHQSGQNRFRAPTPEQVEVFAADIRAGRASRLYLGPRECFEALRQRVLTGITAAALQQDVDAFVAANRHLFSELGDDDIYAWLERYAAFSPIIHLQQTDGTRSAHENFTALNNSKGIISAPKVLRSIQASMQRPQPEGFPPPVSEVYLTLEPFLSTPDHPRAALEDVADSIRYWRQYGPQDGIGINQAVALLP